MKGSLWGPDAPSEDRPLDDLSYRSRLIGFDPDLTAAGASESVKTEGPDFRGRMRPIVRIAESGAGPETVPGGGGAPLRGSTLRAIFRDDVLPLLDREEMSDAEIVAYLEHCLVDPSEQARPSLEWLVHALLPACHVDHVTADAILALAGTEDAAGRVREALGERVAFIPYQRPGLALARRVLQLAPDHDGVIVANHGLISWASTSRECYRKTIDLVERAHAYLEAKLAAGAMRCPTDVKPPAGLETSLLKLRGRLGHVILHLDDGAECRSLADRPDILELANAGPAIPGLIPRIGPWACVLDVQDPAGSIAVYEQRYRRFVSPHAGPDVAANNTRPRVFLIPGLGIVTTGKVAREALATAEPARHSLRVAALTKDAHGCYRTLSEDDLLHARYPSPRPDTVPPAARELAGHIIAVTGAASGIGRAVARHLAGVGAQVSLLDLNEEGLERTASLISEGGGDAPLCITVDLVDESHVRAAVVRIIRTYGGIDGLVSNAGIPATGELTSLDPALWRRSMDVNATSHFLITAEVMRAMTTAGLGGSIVYVASKNAFGPGAGFGAYSAAKAAQVQLARIAALEGGRAGIRANVVNPDAVFEDSLLWSEGVRRERAAAHGVPVEELEQFYARRNLLKTTISGRDVAEAVAFLLSGRSRATTGTVIAVDGGVPAAFPR
jgi:rhamnose utilization protein RhaD (predicted bifunctional aldolase and dehydrogenase)/NAD(P)-dependent dehydrogenase (short-subunit alcohol dehydrogenase family)